MSAASRPKRKSKEPPSKFPLDHSNVFFCFVFENTQDGEKYCVLNFNHDALRLISSEDKLTLSRGARIHLNLNQKLFPARFVCQGNEKLMTRASDILEDLVSECENTDSIVSGFNQKFGKGDKQCTSATRGLEVYSNAQVNLQKDSGSSSDSDNDEPIHGKRSKQGTAAASSSTLHKAYNAEAQMFSLELEHTSSSHVVGPAATASRNHTQQQQQKDIGHDSFESLKAFFKTELQNSERRILHKVRHLIHSGCDARNTVPKQFEDEDLTTISGTRVSLSTIMSSNPTKFVRDFIRLHHGPDYLDQFVIDSHCGNRSNRRKAPDADINEMKRLLRKCYTVSPEQFGQVWQKIKTSLNQIARETKRRKKNTTTTV